jgi:cellulose synthase/poly-beta-1,6-N-acetylglucosamine synthase-like glycosyltransferase
VAVLISAIVGAAATGLLLPTLVDVVHAVRPARRRAPPLPPATPPPHLLFLVPAHDEALLIEACVHSLTRLDYPADRFAICVVADNCTDHTAALARAAGADTLERNEPDLPGKPHALAWAVARLPLARFDAMVIVDADSVVDPGFAREIAASAPLALKVVQAYNGVANPAESALTRMATVLAAARFELIYPLKHRAGINIPLGAGMCIGTGVLSRYGWQVFSIGEDWEFYAFLTARGVPIELQSGARLLAQEAPSFRQSAPQRRRWSAGKSTVLRRYWRPLLLSPHIGARQKLDALSELSAPGPAVHLGIVGALCAAGLALGASPWLLAALAGSLVRPLAYSAAALPRVREPRKALQAFAMLPVYTAWRLVVELGAWATGPRSWVRTARHIPRAE